MSKNASRGIHPENPVPDQETRLIAGLLVNTFVFQPQLVDALKGLHRKGMHCVFQSRVVIRPDSRTLFILSDSPFADERQQLEADCILANLIDSDDPEPLCYQTVGSRGVYRIVDFVRI